MILLVSLARVLLDVRSSSYLGAALAGSPEMGECVSRIAWRESRHELVSIHESDSWMARSLGDGWSTRGAHGMVARYAWPYVPAWLRWSPAVLDVPLVSAVVATRRRGAWQCKQTTSCVRWRECRR